MTPDEGQDSAEYMTPKGATPEQILWLRRARAVAKRSILGDMAAACDQKCRAIRAANPGRKKGSTSQVGEAMAMVAEDIGKMLWAERAKINVPTEYVDLPEYPKSKYRNGVL